MGTNEKAWGIGFKRMIGDESLGATYGIAVDDANKQLHICEIADVGTDWARSASSHPELCIHSATTPATMYLKMYHDATNAYIDAVGATILQLLVAGTAEISIAAASVSPTTTGGAALGTTALMWSDLFLASGAVINFNNGDVTLTHAANSLTFAGGTYTFTGATTISGAATLSSTLAVTGIATMTERVKMATSKPVIQGMVDVPLTTRTALTSGATVTYTAAQLVGGFISDTISAACTATVDTPANIVAAIPGAVVGSSFLFVLRNTAGSAIAITLTANGAATVDGTATVAQSNTKIFLALITSVTSTSEAVVFYSLGTLVH